MLAEARVLLSVVGANYGEYLCIWRTFAGNVHEEHMQVDKNQKVQIKDFFFNSMYRYRGTYPGTRPWQKKKVPTLFFGA